MHAGLRTAAVCADQADYLLGNPPRKSCKKHVRSTRIGLWLSWKWSCPDLDTPGRQHVLLLQVAGMLILNANSVTDSSGEGFAVRLFRKGNQRGFVRAITDNPAAFAAGFNKVCMCLKRRCSACHMIAVSDATCQRECTLALGMTLQQVSLVP